MEEFNIEHHEQMVREHQAWLDVGAEFKTLGLDMNEGGNAVDLHNAIVKWGEELAELRRLDPNPEHAGKALAEKRELYPGTTEGATA